VRLDASSDTGLAGEEVHYWGNAAGNTGNDTFPGVADVAGGDLQGIAQNIDPFPNSLVDNRFDLNKDRRRDGGDLQVISQNVNPFALFYITPNGALASASAGLDLTVGDESVTEDGDDLGGETFSGGNEATEDGRVGDASEGDSLDDAFASFDEDGGSVDDDLLDLLAGGLGGNDLLS
jgi:hypothetical protein